MWGHTLFTSWPRDNVWPGDNFWAATLLCERYTDIVGVRLYVVFLFICSKVPCTSLYVQSKWFIFHNTYEITLKALSVCWETGFFYCIMQRKPWLFPQQRQNVREEPVLSVELQKYKLKLFGQRQIQSRPESFNARNYFKPSCKWLE